MNKVVIALVFLLSSPLFAKDLSNRLGIGYSKMSAKNLDLPSIMANYYPNPELGLSLSLGVQTGDTDSKFALLFKVFRIIFPEDNMNFYMGAGAGILSYKISGTSQSGFELNGFFGVEFFFPGLDSLAFHFEAGLGITSVDSGVDFRTIGDSPIEAGVIFYF